MLAATLLYKKRPAMKPNASPAENDDAEVDEPPARSAGSRSSGRAARFQYGTGDTPLDGYTIKRGVGRGGFGEVYFATSDAGKEVALKLIRRNLDIELRGVRQCLNLKHPNLVSLYDLRTDAADDQWVVMEYVSGESLDEAIDRYPEGMPAEEAIAWLRGIAAGVGYLHSSGIVHRDLKPGNIYIERGTLPIEQRVRIGDYGLSKFISTSKRSGQTESVGTVHYMAPEIAGGRYGREIDTYALGVILYEMLTGRVPFEGESVGEVLMKHLTAEPDLSRIDEPYRSIVARALAKDPESRLSSVEELMAMLPSSEPILDPAAAPITPVVGEVWSPVSRPPHTDHPTPPREPLWAAMVDLLSTAREKWSTWDAPPLLKSLLLLGGVGFLFFSGAWIAVPVTVLPFYLVYYVVWALFFQNSTPQGTERLATTVACKNKPSTPPRKRYNWRAAAKRERRERPTRAKAASLTGSMLVAAAVSIVAGVFAGQLLSSSAAIDATAITVWFASVATLGSWGVLAASAAAETHFEDHLPRRGVNLLAGMLAHQNQEMVTALAFGEDFQRPSSGIGHPGMDAPFGTYPTADGW
ncbi:MAG: protein kinase, partial [Planctomycetota bacterium]